MDKKAIIEAVNAARGKIRIERGCGAWHVAANCAPARA